MLPQQHFIETFVDEFLFPEVCSPGLEGVPMGDAIEVLVKLPLIEVEKVHHLLVLVEAGLHLGRILLAVVELEEHCCEGLHYSLQFFLQDAAAGVGVDQDDDLIVEISEPFELEGGKGFEEGEAARYPVYGSWQLQLQGGVDDAHHGWYAFLAPDGQLAQHHPLAEEVGHGLVAGDFRQGILLVGFQSFQGIFLLDVAIPLLGYLVVIVVDDFALFDAFLGGDAIPAVLEVGHIGGIHFVILLKFDVLFLEGIGHGPDFDEELIDPFLLVEEGTVEGVANVDQVGVADRKEFVHRLVVVLAGKEQPEVGHW